MDTRLQVHHLFCDSVPEATFHMLPNQSLAKLLSPGRYEHGLRRSKLLNYSYVPGELIVCNRGIEEWVRWKSPLQILKLDLPDQAFRAIAEEAGAETIEIASSTNLKDERISSLISAIEMEKEGGFLSGRLYMDSVAQALASVLTQVRGVLRKPLRIFRCGLAPAQLAKVSEAIHSQLERDFSLPDMAAVAGLSTGYFSQMFRRSTGQAPHQFVLNARIERAKELLRQSELRVIDIAVSCGFQTPQHFARVFRAVCKFSPTEYRRKIRY
jgi:AraC family transcriptional regulator